MSLHPFLTQTPYANFSPVFSLATQLMNLAYGKGCSDSFRKVMSSPSQQVALQGTQQVARPFLSGPDLRGLGAEGTEKRPV